MSDKVTTYDGDQADVSWDGRLCIHVGECGKAANDLFQGGRDPWCLPDLVTLDEVVDVVQRCPTGALVYVIEERVEQAPAENTVTVANNGPLYLRGELVIDGAADDMPGTAFRAALCRCGQSANKPFCDNTHEQVGFIDHGAIGERGTPLAAKGGPLVIRRLPNGPLLASGNVTLVAASGRVAWQGTKAAFCRCGHSGNKPFCDGSHTRVGFQAE